MLRRNISAAGDKYLEAVMESRTITLTNRQSLADIEYEVRRLRAEALAKAAVAVRRSVVQFFSRRPAVAPTAKA
jgi:hypothetical protein